MNKLIKPVAAVKSLLSPYWGHTKEVGTQPDNPNLVHHVMMQASKNLRACPINGGGYLLVVEDGENDYTGKVRESWVKFCKDENDLAAQIAAYFTRKKMGVPTGTPLWDSSPQYAEASPVGYQTK